MTREQEQAIDLLDNLIGMIEDNQENDYDKALKMAIQALQAQAETKCNPNDCPHPYGTYETCNECKANGDNVFKMRDATPEEQEAIDKYIKSISKPTGVDFDSLSDSQIIHHLTDKAYSELCLLAEKGREALQAQADGEYISRQDAIEFFKDDVYVVNELKNMATVAIPSAEPKTGHWINKEFRKEEYVLTGKCSVCGRVRVIDEYCPNCGAKMD